MSWTQLMVLAGVLGALGIALGAFGAHGLQAIRSESDLAIWRTAAHYHQVHTLVLLLLAFANRDSKRTRGHWLSWAAIAFLGGVVLFSGSLYLLVLTQIRWLGAITPLGGVLFLCGWASIVGYGITTRTKLRAVDDRKGSP